ncbi:hypothetical protein HK096_009972, partial [Nowakowskiella sp. JEL0078]
MVTFDKTWVENLQSILQSAFQHPLQEDRIIEGLVTSLFKQGIRELHFNIGTTDQMQYSYNGKPECQVSILYGDFDAANCESNSNSNSDNNNDYDDDSGYCTVSAQPENEYHCQDRNGSTSSNETETNTSNTTNDNVPHQLLPHQNPPQRSSVVQKSKRITEEEADPDELDNVNNSDLEAANPSFNLENVVNKFMEEIAMWWSNMELKHKILKDIIDEIKENENLKEFCTKPPCSSLQTLGSFYLGYQKQ